ncbi:MAG: flavin reductase [Acutalibacteraceae bacterium]
MLSEKDVAELHENFIDAIANEWMLISAGDESGYNMMTASWGFVGEMWGKNAAVAAIRPSRYTKEFVDGNDYFTLSFYGKDAKKTIHAVCGSKSGRDVDKAKECGLTPVFADNSVYFEGARLVLVCKKMYVAQMNPANIIDKSVEKWYDNDYHTIYVGEIVKCLCEE